MTLYLKGWYKTHAVFAVLVILGVVTDPTTAGVSDSKQAMTYTEPKKGE